MSIEEITRYIQNLGNGNHISCIYRGEKELYPILTTFFSLGLKNNYKCLYAPNRETPKHIINRLKEFNLNLEEHIEKGSFVFSTPRDTYLQNDSFNIKKTISTIRDAEIAALNEGYRGLWGAGSASWINDHLLVKDDFICYEAEVNKIIKDSKMNILCLYDEEVLGKDILIEVLRTHPLLYLHNKFVNNSYFAVLDKFAPLEKIHSPEEEYKKLISSL